MDLGLEGKSAIVTGGSLGIGTAVALALAKEGCNVAINYRRHDTEAKEVVRKIEEMGRKRILTLVEPARAHAVGKRGAESGRTPSTLARRSSEV